MRKSLKMIAAALALSLGLCACGGASDPVPVEQAGMLSGVTVSADKFAGVVVSENAVEIQRDMDKNIQDLYVSVGDEVRINEKLFSYDVDELKLTIDKQELEMDRLEAQIKEHTTQITNLEKQIKNEQDKEVKATLELQLRSVKADKTQAEYDKSALQTEINYNKKIAANADVRSPIAGTIRAINEEGEPYITIQQAGAYQVKGTLNELSLNAGIMEGVAVTVLSRVDPELTWNGTVTLVDYNNTMSNGYDEMYGYVSDSGMNTSTSYPFYITLDMTDGLLLGQHVYITLASAPADDGLLRIPESYLMDVAYDEATGNTVANVWTIGEEGTLILAPVTLGEYDMTYGCYVVWDGITAESYIADPAHPGCKEGAQVSLRNEDVYTGADLETEPTGSVPAEGTDGASVPGETGASGATEGGV